MTPVLEVGDIVYWAAAKGGKVRCAQIFAGVPAGEPPSAHMPSGDSSWVLHFDPDSVRREASWIVGLVGEGTAGRQLYRPPAWRLSKSRPVTAPVKSDKAPQWRAVAVVVAVMAIATLSTFLWGGA